jgi:methylglyoxal synthase
MHIALIADDKKKELLTELCIAYCGILAKHHLYATNVTGKYISEATGLEIETFLPGAYGGIEQITSRVAFDEIDLLLFFRDMTDGFEGKEALELIRACDLHNVPFATNLATAEIMLGGLERGDLDWREFVNPRSAYNIKKRNA